MRQVLSGMCVATVLSMGVGLSAQSGTMDKGQMDKMKEGQTTVSGCVTAGKDASHYMLSNAMMMGGTMDKAMMDKDKMAKPGMDGQHMMSYELVGGDLKGHVGHKVEVTGSMSKMDMDRMAKMEKMDKMAKDKMMAQDMKAMTLNVTSVKMVSPTCP